MMKDKIKKSEKAKKVVEENKKETEEKVKAGAKELDRETMTDDEYIEGLEERVGVLMEESTTCRMLTQRIQADFDNYRKRNETLAEESKKLGQSLVIDKMLGVLDNCDYERKYLKDEAALQGFNMMETQIVSALEGFGLKVIEAEGLEFDAKTMNALEREKSEGNEGKVLEVQSKGYTLDGKVIRPAGVKVGY